MKKILFSLLASASLFSCGDFDEINTNPDTPTTVTSPFLATKVILDATSSSDGKWFISDSWLVKQTTFTEHMEWYLYNKFERTTFGNYSMLIDASKMKEIADETMAEDDRKAYDALYHFIHAYVFYGATMELGDVPCSEAGKGETDALYAPKYDPQEQVFETILDHLTAASALFAEAPVFEGDPVYNGDVSLWEKAVNGYTLRVLNMLSKKDQVGKYNVKQLFEETAAKPLFASEEENFQRVYSADKSSQWYPFYWEKQNYWSYPFMTSFLVDMMKDLQDKRLFYYAEPAAARNNYPESSFDAYSGVDPTLIYGSVQDECNKGLHSAINQRYHRMAEGEPVKFIAYSEIQFILAEAALRGWKTPASAKTHYENGVRAAMEFTAAHTPETYRHGVTIDAAAIDEYLKGKAAFDPSKGLEQVMCQKFIASLFQLPFNSYYDYRRTGLPVIPINPVTNMNEVKEQLPLRWMYPEAEYSQNRANIEEAIQRQFGGSDTPNEVMWLLK